MAGLELNASSIVVLISLVFVVLGFILMLTWFFKKQSALDSEERFNIERTKVLYTGAAALALVSLVAMGREARMKWGARAA